MLATLDRLSGGRVVFAAGLGATWWLEAIYGRSGSLAELLDCVDHGPPPTS
jgi:alkanesulfonate monooxygenase SsuD/methylene tetrahydromethanopterin reductase-like flavin-dependent oxidoreductase (luciferase family)